ncbi:hypothetical protein [Vibrio sp. 10N.261.51.F12]|uniref:hypothetical protein n=1 Tax=Vibrio sp. 10N.261.51.F12 TaxID=3229679 RepID=UPI00354F9806
MRHKNTQVSKFFPLLILIAMASILGCEVEKSPDPNTIDPNQVVRPKDGVIRNKEAPGYDPTPRVLVTKISINDIMIRKQADSNISRIYYQADNNRWVAEYFTEKNWKPINYKSTMIGKENDIPSYAEIGSMRADPCIHHYYILTNDAYAIEVEGFNTCGAYEETLSEFLKSYSLPQGIKAYEVKLNSSWPSVLPR